MEQRLLIPISDAAYCLGISRSSIYRLIQQGRMRTVKFAGRRLVPKAELDRIALEEATLDQEAKPAVHGGVDG